MNAVGRHHSTGKKSSTRIPCPYPAPEITSSVPYVPPETMKNVAATSGHSVILATLVFVLEIVREGSWAGRDNVLNFYRRPPKATFVFSCKTNSHFQNTSFVPPRKKIMHRYDIFFARVPVLADTCTFRDSLARPTFC